MRPTFYMDLDLRSGTEANKHDMMSFAVQRLHHATTVGKFALGFPTLGGKLGLGNKVRVFAETAETLTQIADFMLQDWRVDEYLRIRHPKPVPSSVERYEAFFRFRFSHELSSSRKERLKASGIAEKLDARNAAIRAKQADLLNRSLSNTGFATIYSSTTNRQFRLYVERRPCHEVFQGEPDGYGLSRRNNVVALPVFS